MNRFFIFVPLGIFLLFINIQSFAGVCWVTNINDSGAGSLRAAINCVNGNIGRDTIKFNILGTAPFVIKPQSEFPKITDTTIVDATTQSNYYLGIIEIDGKTFNRTDGLWFQKDYSEIYGLFVHGFQFNEILIEANNCKVGDTGKGNVLSGNSNIELLLAGRNIIVKDNFLGTNVSGTNDFDATGQGGIYFSTNTRDILIENNVISGLASAMNIWGGSAYYNITIRNNKIGTDVTGNIRIGNSNAGLYLGNIHNFIIESNIISGNGDGIYLSGSTNGIIRNNFIGVAADSTTSIPNSGEGIKCRGSVGVGGTDSLTVTNNIIAYNANRGVTFGTLCKNNFVTKNKIYCNALHGIYLWGGSGNLNKSKPIISSATTTRISGTSQANDIIEIFYSDNSNCSSAPCQGKTFLATTTTDVNGNWAVNGSFILGNQVTATSTDTQKNTSEFANCIVVCAAPSVSLTAPTQTLCNGSTVLLTANTAETGLQYQWSRNGANITNATQTTYSVNQAGQYAVKVSRANGCDSTATLFIKPPILVDSGLVAYYPFDGDALDYSGNGNHGTPQNVINYAADRQGSNSKAASFTSSVSCCDSTGSHVRIPNLVNNTTTQLSISMWVYEVNMTSDGSSYIGFGSHDSPHLKGITHITATGLLYFNLDQNATDSTIISIPFPTSFRNKWKHYVMTYKNGVLSAYIDGVLIGTKTQTINMPRPELAAIARHWYRNGTTTATRFTGKMDDIRIYNRALTAAEIQLLYKPAAYNFARCTGDTLKLTAPSVSGVSYTWKKGTTTLGTGTIFSKNNIALADTGTYNLDISYKGCTFSDTTVVNSIKTKPSVTLNDTSICAGSSAYLQVPTGFSTYQWSVGSSTSATNTITPLSTQPVSVTVTNANGCTASDTATITVLPASLNCGLVAHYKLDGNARDTSGNGNHGTPVGGVTWTKDRFGNCGSAASFDGIDDVIDFAKSPTSNTDNFTISLWIKAPMLNQNGTPILLGVDNGVGSNPSLNGVSIHIGNNSNVISYFLSDIGYFPSTKTISIVNNWYHIVFQRDNGNYKMYLDGIQILNTAGNTPRVPTDLKIGSATGIRFFNGSIDDIRIFNRALTAAEITQLYNQAETGKRPPSAQITNSTPSVCTGSTTLLSAAPTGNGFQYQWFKDSVLIANATTATYSTGQAGRYQVRVTDATGCDSLSVSTVLTVNPLPVPDASNDTAICQNSTASLWIKNNSANFRSYTWSTSPTTTAATANVTPSVSTKYFVTVTDANGCSGKDSVTVTVNQNPKPLVNDTTICLGSPVTIWTRNASANFRNYNWTDAMSTSVSANASFTSIPSVSTSFFLNVTDVNGCSGKDTATITVNALPTVNFSGNVTICSGQSTQLKASGGTIYRWSNAATKDTTTVSPAATSWYLVTVTNANGCAKTDSVRVVVNTLPIPTITGNPLFCKGLTTNLTASGGTSYRWQTGVTTNQIGINQAGTYTVTVTNASNCTTTKSIVVAARTLVSTAILTNVPCFGFKNGAINATVSTIGTANPPYTLTWTGNVGTPTNTANTTLINALAAGNYPLSIRDLDGCKLDTTFMIREPDSIRIALVNIKNETCSTGNDGQISVTATEGTPPFQYKWSRAAQDIQPTIANLKQGNYTLTVTDAAQCVKNRSFTIGLTFDNLLAPTVSVVNSTPSSITFGWSAVPNATRYEVKIKDSVWMVPNGTLQYTVSGLNQLETIDFKVRAISSNPLCTTALVGNTTGTTKEKPIEESCFEEMKKNIPDAFSPNDDGINELFDPEKYFILSGCPFSLHAEQLIIVSRWGEVIYQANPYKAWDGRSSNYKNAVMPSAYYYVLMFKIEGKERLIKGVINCFSR